MATASSGCASRPENPSVPPRRSQDGKDGEVDEYAACMCCGTQQGRVARLLKCFHNVCDECLQHLLLQTPVCSAKGEAVRRESTPAMKVRCFRCQAVTSVATTGSRYGVEWLVKNQQLSRRWLVNRLATERGTGVGRDTGGDPTKSSVMCDECVVGEGYEEDDPPTVVCLDCSTRLCRDHARIHRKTRSTAKHSLYDTSSQRDLCTAAPAKQKSMTTACPNHSRELCQLFCKTCNEGFCDRCRRTLHNSDSVSGSSVDHIVHDLEDDFVTTLEEEVARMAPAVEERETQLTRRLQLLDAEEKEINKHAENLSVEITSTYTKTREAVLAVLEKKECGTLQEVDNVRWADLSRLSKERLPLQQEQSMLQHATSLAESFKQISGQADRASACVFWTASVSSALPQSPSSDLSGQCASYNSRMGVVWDAFGEGRLLRSVSVSDKANHSKPNQPQVVPSKTTLPKAEEVPTAMVVKSTSSLVPLLSCQTGGKVDGLRGYISAVYEVCTTWTGKADSSINIGKKVSRKWSQRQGEQYCDVVFSEEEKLPRSSKILLEFKVPMAGGTYALSANKISFSEELSLSRCPFSFHDSTFQNAKAYGDGRGVAVTAKSRFAGAALGPPFSGWGAVGNVGNVTELHVMFVNDGGPGNPTFGIVSIDPSGVQSHLPGLSVDWRARHTSVLFNGAGEVFIRRIPGRSVLKQRKFDNISVPLPDWGIGSVLKLRLKTVGLGSGHGDGNRTFEVSLACESPGKSKSQTRGFIKVVAKPEFLYPYFWFSPDSFFQLVPPLD